MSKMALETIDFADAVTAALTGAADVFIATSKNVANMTINEIRQLVADDNHFFYRERTISPCNIAGTDEGITVPADTALFSGTVKPFCEPDPEPDPEPEESSEPDPDQETTEEHTATENVTVQIDAVPEGVSPFFAIKKSFPDINEIIRLRKEEGLSTKQIADKLHYSPKAVKQVELLHVKERMKQGMLQDQIAEWLGKSQSYISKLFKIEEISEG